MLCFVGRVCERAATGAPLISEVLHVQCSVTGRQREVARRCTRKALVTIWGQASPSPYLLPINGMCLTGCVGQGVSAMPPSMR